MKNIFLAILFISQFAYSQQYILLDELEKAYEVNKYTLDTKKMYNINAEIEIYNIHQRNNLLLISVLPDLFDNFSWKKISLNSIQEKTVSLKEVLKEVHKLSQQKFLNQYLIVKKINDEYFVTKNCLLEIFIILDEENLQVSAKNVINTKQKLVTYQEIKKKRKGYSPMENSWWGERYSYLDEALKYTYLSQIEEKNNEKIYHFWTFDDWHIRDSYNYHRGIDRFAYIPKKGIVGGSYDFYFDMVGSDYAINRVVRYDIMWSKELFPERQ